MPAATSNPPADASPSVASRTGDHSDHDTSQTPRQAGEDASKKDSDDGSAQEAIETSSSWFSSLVEKRSKLTSENFEMGLKLFGAITVVLAGLQYFNSIRREEVSKTLELIAIWEQGELQKSYAKISDRISDINNQNSAFLAIAPNAVQTRVYQNKVGSQLIRPTDGTAPLKQEVEAIFGFLDRVGFCVKHEICSKLVASEYFGESATSMFEYFGDFVVSRRKTVPSFARATEYISTLKM